MTATPVERPPVTARSLRLRERTACPCRPGRASRRGGARKHTVTPLPASRWLGALAGLLVLVVPASGASADPAVGASLRPARTRDADLAPLAQAILTVDNRTDAPLRSIAIQDAHGGVTFVYRLAVPPGEQSSRSILLPATWIEQSYTAQLLADEPPDVPLTEDVPGDNAPPASAPRAVATTRITCSWPSEWVEGEAWVVPERFAALAPARAAWGASLRRHVLLVGAVAVLGVVVSLLPRPPWARAAVLCVVAVAASGAMAWLVASEPIEVRWRVESPRGPLQAVAARRRSAVALSPAPIVPLYRSAGDVQRDRAQIVEGAGLRAVLPAGDIRLFATPRTGQRVVPGG